MHGDLVNAICYTAFCPVYAYLWFQEPEPSPEARDVNVAFVWTMVFSWISYYRNSVWASVLAISGMTVSIAFMNLYGWPHEGQVVVEPQFLWSLLIISGNGHLPYMAKLALGVIALSGATYVAKMSPLVDLKSVLPTLLGAFVIYCTFHFIVTKDPKKLVSAYGASLLLAGSFSFHVTSEMVKIVSTPGYGKSGGYAILVAGFFAVVGFFSSRAFQEEIFLNNRLETAVKERTREVEQQAKRLVVVEHALQASDTCIAVLDSDYSILWSNAAFKAMLRLESDLGAGRMFDTFSLLSKTPLDPTSKTREVKLGDQSFAIDLSEFPGAPEETEKIAYKTNRYLLVMKDITAIRAREAAEKAADKEATQAKAMKEAMQNLSHELRTPLQGIIGMTSLLLSKEDTSDEIAESMTMVMTSSRLLLTLINNMLDVQKMNANMLGELDLSSCNLPTILDSAVDFCLPLATVHDLSLKTDHDEGKDDGVFVQTNKLRLQQVIINLLSNAIKYSPTHGSISVRTRRRSMSEVRRCMAGALASSMEPAVWHSAKDSTSMSHDERTKEPQFAIVSVSDQGNGIPKEKAGQLFRRFASNWSTCPRVADDNSKEEPFGTGLGLNLCKRFVERMNGAIWVENVAGGATFSFALKADPPTFSGRSKTKKVSTLPSKLLNGNKRSIPVSRAGRTTSTGILVNNHYRILVVDDVRMNLKVAQRLLISIGIKEVDTALSGAEALEMIEKAHSSGGEPYALVISDLQMPFMSGLELSTSIQSLELAQLPVVVGFTADTGPDIVAACLSSGMREVLHKPTTKNELQDLILRFSKSREEEDSRRRQMKVVTKSVDGGST